MKYKWLNKTENQFNKKLIVFFNGWGMDENIVNNLSCENYNVLMFYDYNNLDVNFDFSILKEYLEKYLVAWSMGVMIATLFDLDYKSRIAINGTLKPIDDKYGIPSKIYNLTLKGFSPIGAQKFIKNMFKENYDLPKINRDFEGQKTELEALTHYKANMNFKYDKVLISSEDKIIPTKNQVKFWNMKPNIDSGHAPFNNFTKWSELL